MTKPMRHARVAATFDPALDARLMRRVSLVYSDGADSRVDRPGHIRAGSSLVWIGTRLAVAQDDANFIGLVDPVTGMSAVLTLPGGKGGLRQFDDARGNKRDKHDFEAMAAVDWNGRQYLLLFGSG